MSEDVAEKVIAIVAMLKKLPRERITPEATLEELGVDSLDKVNLLFELESAFDLDIPDEAARQVRTVGDIVRSLEAIGAKSGSAGA